MISRRRDRRSGFTLIMVMGQLALLISVWSIANRHTGAIMNLEIALDDRVKRDQGSLTAIATALSRLETGLPPTSTSAEYILTLSTSRGELTYLVTFTQLGDSTRWQVDAVPVPVGCSVTTPLPTTFATESP